MASDGLKVSQLPPYGASNCLPMALRSPQNLVIEIAPGWWPLYANTTSHRVLPGSADSYRRSKPPLETVLA